MRIHVIQLIQCALSDSVVRQLAGRFGLPGEATDRVISAAAPARVAARIHKGATPEGARSLFTTIVAPELNAHIGEQLPQLLASAAGLSQHDGAGRKLLEHLTDRRIAGLSDTVAAQPGAPAQSTPTPTAPDLTTLKRPLSRRPSTRRRWARLR